MDYFLTSYRDAIESLFARTNSGTRLGLERTEALLAALGNPHRSIRAIHIAGTNGKGSVVATAEALLRANGLKVGRYTSPHLVDFRERISVNGEPIPESAVLRFLQDQIELIEKTEATFFEATTALAFHWLHAREVDIAVIETGLGGRLDSTNVVTPEVATVTSIGLDHTDMLGDTLEEIAAEKAGIFKPGRAAIIGDANPEIAAVLAGRATAAGATPIVRVAAEFQLDDITVSRAGTSFTLTCGGERLHVQTPLVGAHQAWNTTVAIASVAAVDASYVRELPSLSAALERVFLPGRFQRRGKFIFDVAHNPAGARALATAIQQVNPPEPRSAVIAVLADKDWRGILRELAPAVDRFIITNAPSAPPERRWDPAAAHAFALGEGLAADLEPDLDTAIVRSQKRCGTVIVTGSFHTVGDVMSRLQVSPFAA